MATVVTEIEKTIRGLRDCDLRGLRSIEFPQLRTSTNSGPDRYRTGTSNGSTTLHNEAGRIGRMSSENRTSGTRNEFLNDYETYKREVTLSRVKNRIFLMALEADTDFYDYALEWLANRIPKG